MKTKKMILAGMLLGAILPAAAQNNLATPMDNGSFGQLLKGSFNITGSVGYTSTGTSTATTLTPYSSKADSTSVPNGKSSTYNINLNPGYLIADGLQVGLVFGYTNTTTLENVEASANNSYYSWNNVSSTFQLGIGATKYYAITNNFYFKCSITGYYNTGTTSNSFLDFSNTAPVVTADPTLSTAGFQITLAPGLEYFPSARWGINFNLNNLVNYTSSTATNTQYAYASGELAVEHKVTTNSFNIGAGLTPTLGVRYTFGRVSASSSPN